MIYFEFNDKIYRQEPGTAIGTKFVSFYTDLLSGRLEEESVGHFSGQTFGSDEIHQ